MSGSGKAAAAETRQEWGSLGSALLLVLVFAEEVLRRLLPLRLARRGSLRRSGGSRKGSLRLVFPVFVRLRKLRDADDAVAVLQLDDAHALGRAARLPDVLDLDPDQLPALRDEEKLIGVRDGLDAGDGAVLVGDLDVDDARAAAPLEAVLRD